MRLSGTMRRRLARSALSGEGHHPGMCTSRCTVRRGGGVCRELREAPNRVTDPVVAHMAVVAGHCGISRHHWPYIYSERFARACRPWPRSLVATAEQQKASASTGSQAYGTAMMSRNSCRARRVPCSSDVTTVREPRSRLVRVGTLDRRFVSSLKIMATHPPLPSDCCQQLPCGIASG